MSSRDSRFENLAIDKFVPRRCLKVLAVVLFVGCARSSGNLIDQLSEIGKADILFEPGQVSKHLGAPLYREERVTQSPVAVYLTASNSALALAHPRYTVSDGDNLPAVKRDAVLVFDTLDQYACFTMGEVRSKLDDRFPRSTPLRPDLTAWTAYESRLSITIITIHDMQKDEDCVQIISLYSAPKL